MPSKIFKVNLYILYNKIKKKKFNLDIMNECFLEKNMES